MNIHGLVHLLSRATTSLVGIGTASIALVVLCSRTIEAQDTQPGVFSATPTDTEFWHSRSFSEPIVPMSGKVSDEENRALVQALRAFDARTDRDDVSALQQFLSSYPKSRWRLAVLVQIGKMYRVTGYFSRALDAWEEAWRIGKDEDNHDAKALADTAAAELGALYSRLGRREELQQLFKDLKKRPASGSPEQKLEFAREAFVLMDAHPETSFKCGPYALQEILGIQSGKSSRELDPAIAAARSSKKGFSLEDVQHLAVQVGLKMQKAHRSPTAMVIVPSVVHWKSGHFAAITAERDGLYFVEDRTFDERFWVSKAALDDEASGAFLIPEGDLPAGWETVNSTAASAVWGRGVVSGRDPAAFSTCDRKSGGDQGGCCGSKAMPRYSVHTMMVSLNIEDTPVGYTPPFGPDVPFTVTYNQMDSYQPATFNYSNLGSQWTFNWLSYIEEQNPYVDFTQVRCYLPGGGVRFFQVPPGAASTPDPQSQATLARTQTSPITYEMVFPDGSKYVYDVNAGGTPIRKLFLSKVVDPQGREIQLIYDTYFRVGVIKDALGQQTLLSYDLSSTPSDGDAFYKLTKVTDPFGRFASFGYTSTSPRQLIGVTDVMGIASSFGYSGSSITTLTTPYGTTTFNSAAASGDVDGNGTTEEAYRWILITDPMMFRERIEWRNLISTSVVPQTEAENPGTAFDNDSLQARNSFYWDRKAMQSFTGSGTPPTAMDSDYRLAKLYHWNHGYNGQTVTSGAIESYKQLSPNSTPFHNRVFYGGSAFLPSDIGVVIEGADGATAANQITSYVYNSIGQVTQFTDPTGRITKFEYDPSNNIDLTAVKQQNNASGNDEVLLTVTYNSGVAHLPKTATDAAGKVWTFNYTPSKGQLWTITNPKTPNSETITFGYDATGYYLTSITGPQSGATTSFTYDSYGRVRTITDSEGYTVTHDYDALDRLTKRTFADNTYEQTTYGPLTSRPLDIVAFRDRLGRVTTYGYDALRRLTSVTDPLGRATSIGWCACGGMESLTTYKDGNPQTTTWERDLIGRVTGKVFPEGLQNRKIGYSYEPRSGRLQEVTTGNNSRNQKVHYKYYIDNNVKEISYLGALITTTNVTFTYDTVYNRLTDMLDGTSATPTHFTYKSVLTLGAGQLDTINGAIPNSLIQYNYDELGRVVNRTINGTAQSVTYDSLGRINTALNPLGSFTYNYLNTTARLLSIVSSGNQVRTDFAYFPNVLDQQLREIKNQRLASTPLSKFNYTYDSADRIRRWTQQADSATPTDFDLGYDNADQLQSAIGSVSGSASKTFSYTYDTAGNRKTEQVSTTGSHTVTTTAYNSDNQMTGRTVGGSMLFKGQLDELGRVTINGNTALTLGDRTFTGSTTVNAGLNTITIQATDPRNNVRTKQYQVTVGGTAVPSYTYDENGNLTANGNVSYYYDGADRLVKVINGSLETDFAYDGFGRRVRITEKSGATTTSDKRYLWCGTELCEERDSTGATVTKRYYAQGVQDGGANYYYARDHLGSIREVVNSTGTVVARYDYDPYGRRTKIAGSYIADFGYTGWYFHPAEDGAAGGLQLALYRAYSPDLGRWLNRDPIGEAGGINLYTFVDNDSIDEVDPDGLYGNPIPGIINFNTGTGAGDVGRVGLFPNPSPTGAAVLNTGLSFVPFGNVSVGGAEIISDPKNPLGYASLIPGEKIAKCLGKAAATAIELHHLLPQSKRLAPFFKRAGLNIEDFKLPLDKAKHRLRPNGIHTGPSEESWNGTWESFFKANPGATKQAILDQLAKMRNDFGI